MHERRRAADLTDAIAMVHAIDLNDAEASTAMLHELLLEELVLELAYLVTQVVPRHNLVVRLEDVLDEHLADRP